MTHKTRNLKYALFFSGKLLQLNEILAREKGRREYSSSVAVGIIMLWQSQFMSLSPRGIVSEIIGDEKMFAQFGLENSRYSVTTNNVISGSIRKNVSIRALEDVKQW